MEERQTERQGKPGGRPRAHQNIKVKWTAWEMAEKGWNQDKVELTVSKRKRKCFK